MDWFQQLKDARDKDQAERQAQYQGLLQPGDETKPADTFGNTVQNTLGLPESWRQTVAQEKQRAVQPQPLESKVSPLVAGPEEEGAQLAAQSVEGLGPKLNAIIQNIRSNPNAPLEVSGPINMSRFQKLRDALGHTGRIVVKDVK